MAGRKCSSEVGQSDIDPLNSMFVKLSTELGEGEVETMKHLLIGKQIKESDRSKLQDGAAIFHHLRKQGDITVNNLSLLKDLVINLNRLPLAELIDSFQGHERPEGDDEDIKSSNNHALTSSDEDKHVPSDNQKRWLAFGIHAEEMTHVVAKRLDVFFERYYAYLKQNHSIHDQSGSYFQSDHLNYRNINDNKNSKGKYNYNVNNHIDLAKLHFRKLNSDFSKLSEVDLLSLFRVLTDLCNEELVQEHICSTSVEIQRVVGEALESIEKWIDCDYKDWEETTYIKDMNNIIHVVESLDGNGTKEALLSKLEHGKSKEQVKCLRNATPDALTTLSSFITKLSTIRKRGSEIGTENAETIQARLDSAHSLIRTLTSHIESGKSRRTSNYDELYVYSVPCLILIASILILVNVNFIVICLIFLVITENIFSQKESAICIGRKRELRNLRRVFEENCNNVKVAVVSGNEGIGKTTIVNEYVRQHINEYYDGVFRISARNEKTVYYSLIMISIDKTLEGVDSRDCLRKLLEHLKSKSNWLIIVDDVNSSDLSDDVNDIINGPWKRVAVGNMIVITRCSVGESVEFVKNIVRSNCVQISKIDPLNAAKFFTSVKTADDAGKLANEFEHNPLVLTEANNTMALYHGKIQTFIQDVRHRKVSNERDVIETMSDTKVNLDALMHVRFHAIDSMCTGKKRKELLLARRLLNDFAVMGEASLPFDQISDGMSLIDHYLLRPKNREDVWQQLLKITRSRDELRIPPYQRETFRGSLSANEKIISLIDACKLLQPRLEEIIRSNQEDVISTGDQNFMKTWQNILCHAIEVSKCIVNFLNEETETSSEQREVMVVFLYLAHIICRISEKHNEALIFKRNSMRLMATIDDQQRDSSMTKTLRNVEYNRCMVSCAWSQRFGIDCTMHGMNAVVEKSTNPSSPVDGHVKMSDVSVFNSLLNIFSTYHAKVLTATECKGRPGAKSGWWSKTFAKLTKCKSCKLGECRVRRLCNSIENPSEQDITYYIPEGSIDLKDLRVSVNNRYVAENRGRTKILVSEENSELCDEGIIYLEGLTIEISHTLVIGGKCTLILKDCNLQCDAAASSQQSPSIAAFHSFESHDVAMCPIVRYIRYGIGDFKIRSQEFMSGKYTCPCEGINQEELSVNAALVLRDDSKLVITNCTLRGVSMISNGILTTENSQCIIENCEISTLYSALTVLGGEALVENSRLYNNVTAIRHFPLTLQSRLTCISNHIFRNDNAGFDIMSRFSDVDAEYELNSNYIYHNGDGFLLESDGKTIVENNSFCDNFRGLVISCCETINITNNNIYDNKDVGVRLINVSDKVYSSVVDKSNAFSVNGTYDIHRSILEEQQRGGTLHRKYLKREQFRKKEPSFDTPDLRRCSICFQTIPKSSAILSCANCLALKFCSESCQTKHMSKQVKFCTELKENYTVQFKLEGLTKCKSRTKEVATFVGVHAFWKIDWELSTIMLEIMNGFDHDQKVNDEQLQLSEVLQQSGKLKLIAEKRQGNVEFGKYAKCIYCVATIIDATKIRISLLNAYSSAEELNTDFSIVV